MSLRLGIAHTHRRETFFGIQHTRRKRISHKVLPHRSAYYFHHFTAERSPSKSNTLVGNWFHTRCYLIAPPTISGPSPLRASVFHQRFLSKYAVRPRSLLSQMVLPYPPVSNSHLLTTERTQYLNVHHPIFSKWATKVASLLSETVVRPITITPLPQRDIIFHQSSFL
jgi:hypothetical protein